MNIDDPAVDQRRLADLRASLTAGYAAQSARLRELTELTADTGDPGAAYDHSALVAATRTSIEQINGALRRIADGSYGVCEKCAVRIPVARLEALPHARFCVPCQSKQHG
ncbi:TraR/DksA family transcriptional regulator [Micromonospora sp. WMMA1923]|uniref:TraR/DksA family transcriptional regulator n=1 Tax=Micromonospora sp. WMMA1923 TaxID=3404125 RepID=UPI003B93EEFF